MDDSDKGNSSGRKTAEKQGLITQKKKSQWTFWLIFTSAVILGGSSFQFGYNTACINAPEEDIKKYFRSHTSFNDLLWATTVAIFAVGGMVGALAGPFIANSLGRKMTLLWNNVPAIVGAVLMFSSYFTKGPALLIVGRFVIGVNSGVNTVVAPVYLSEIAPINIRGSLGTLNQFGIVTGMLVGYLLGLEQILGTATGWKYLLGFSFVPAILQVITLPLCPRSPRYLLLKLSKETEAVQALRLLRNADNVGDDIAEMRIEQEQHLRERTVGVIKLFLTRSLQRPLLIGVVLQLSQQLSGINGVFYYSTSIFETAGVKSSRLASCAVGLVNLVVTGIVVRLVEVAGRRTLLLIGLGGIFFSFSLMTVSFRYEDAWSGMNYISVATTLLAVTFFQVGPGAIPWFITAELFSQGPRSAAVSVAGVVNWFANFVVGIVFPSIQSALYPYTFLVFMALVAGFFIFTFFFVPETKGRTIEEITRAFRRDEDVIFHKGNDEDDDSE